MSYYQLTPDVIIDALSSIGIHVDTGLMALNSYDTCNVYIWIRYL